MSTDGAGPHVLVGFDGTPPAVAAIEVGAALLGHARATVVHLWTPPFASKPLRLRLRERAATMDELMDSLEREGTAEAERLVRTGRILAEAAGWTATTLITRSFGGDGFRFAALAGQHHADVVVLGTRGLTGASAMSDSFADLVVHHSPVPVLVVPHPLLIDDRERAESGPVVVGWDGSPDAARALRHAATLLPGRELVTVSVGDTRAPTDPVEATGLDPVAAAERLGRTARHLTVAEPTTVARPARGAARELILAAHDERAGLLVVGSRGRSVWREALLGSTALAVLHHAHLPVLIVPASAREEPDGVPEAAAETAPVAAAP